MDKDSYIALCEKTLAEVKAYEPGQGPIVRLGLRRVNSLNSKDLGRGLGKVDNPQSPAGS